MTREEEWRRLDDLILGWWDDDLVDHDRMTTATPDAFMLPKPFIAGGAAGSPLWYRTMFDWDTHFINLALTVHGKAEVIDGHLENYLAMIDRFGYMPNGNQLGLSTRSQPPVVIESFWRRLRSQPGFHLAPVYTRFAREYRYYWLAEHHATPTGLVTHRDLGDPTLDPRLAAEAESGLDFTIQFEGDIRRTNPVLINAALVVYARVLGEMATALDLLDEAAAWQAESEQRAESMRRYCWSDERGMFLDYRFDEQRHVDTAGASAYAALWAGVATPAQARRSAQTLPLLLEAHGLATTERVTAFDSDRYALPYEDLQWTHPANWPPLSLLAVQGFDAYGLDEPAVEIAERQLDVILDTYRTEKQLFEKYNAVEGGIALPNSRYGTIPLHGWTSASVVLLGRRVVQGLPFDEQLDGAGG